MNESQYSPASPIDLNDLTAADPVRMADLPRSTEPAAEALLESIVSQASGSTPASSNRRNKFLSLAAVAAAIVAVAGFMVFSPSNTATALAEVKSAAQEAAAANSGRATTTFSLNGSDGSQTESVSGLAVLTYNGDDFAVEVDFDQLPAELMNDQTGMIDILGGIETRLVDGVVYGRGGPFEEWIGMELPSIMTDEIRGLIDPRAVLETVQSLVETEEVGSAEVEGVAVTHYQSVVDLADETLAEAGWISGLESQVDIDADGVITIDLFVDADGQLRQLTVSGDLASAAEGQPGSAQFSVNTVFSDLSGVDPIVAPEGAMVNSFFPEN